MYISLKRFLISNVYSNAFNLFVGVYDGAFKSRSM